MTDRTISGISFDATDEDSMVNFSVSALDSYDIYRVSAQETTAGT
jgi:hypothetical protein